MNRILRFYYSLPHDYRLGFITKIINRLTARTVKRVLDRIVPAYFIKTQNNFPSGINKEPRDQKVIVSLTSFPGRINDVWIVIECLLRQSFKPDKIVLWLSKEQFPDYQLPQNLLAQKERGLEINFVKDDLRSHKKYIYAFEDFPDAKVITVDDDLYYDRHLIRNLIELKKRFPNDIATNRAHLITYSVDGSINNYSKWKHNIDYTLPSYNMVQTGGFGTLYNKEDLSISYNNVEIIKLLIPFADDLWLKTQTLLTSKKVVTNNRYNKDPITIKKSQMEKLVNTNVISGGNDSQLRAVLDHFKLGNLETFQKEKN